MQRVLVLLRRYIPDKLYNLAKLFYQKKKLTLATGVIAFIGFIICCFLLLPLYAEDIHKTYIGIDLLNLESNLENSYSCYSSYGNSDESCRLKDVSFFLDFNKRGKDKLRITANFDLPEEQQNEEQFSSRRLSISASRKLRLNKRSFADDTYGILYDSSKATGNYKKYFFDLATTDNSGHFELDATLEGNIFGNREDEHSLEIDLTNLLDPTSRNYRFPFRISIPVPIDSDVSFTPKEGIEEPISHGYIRYSSQSLLEAASENSTIYYGAPYYINVHWSDRAGQNRERFKLYIFGVMTTIALSVLVGVLREFISFCEAKMFESNDEI